MSNSRLFCIAFVVCGILFFVLDARGIKHTFSSPDVVVRFIGCVTLAIGVVAIRGDRK